MTAPAPYPPDPEDDALAAEFVLGVLDGAERARASERIAGDAAFARLVADWEGRLSGLNEGFAPVPPPSEVKAAVDARLFGEERRPGPLAALWTSLGFWRLLSGAALTAAAVAIVIALQPPAEPPPGETLVATLQSPESDLRFVALYDTGTGELRVTRTEGEAPSDRDLELWLIAGEAPPVSLGLVGRDAPRAPAVAPALKPRLVEGTVLAVSLEPLGGSPTGAPTGPVVALGPAQRI